MIDKLKEKLFFTAAVGLYATSMALFFAYDHAEVVNNMNRINDQLPYHADFIERYMCGGDHYYRVSSDNDEDLIVKIRSEFEITEYHEEGLDLIDSDGNHICDIQVPSCGSSCF